MISKKKKIDWTKVSLVAVGIAALIGLILYGLADRYLIRHVEQTVSAAGSSQSGSGKSGENSAAVSDEWNYQDDSVTVKIGKKETGAGNSKITYYVADVLVSDASELKSAFADNQFGRNIVEYTSSIAKANHAVFAVNGDYYGFRTDGITIRNGVVYRDVPAREGLAFYSDGSMKVYDETMTSARELLSQGVINTYSFGPALLENGKAITNFSDVEIDNNFGNREIQSYNPRTGVGILGKNHFLFVVVDGRSNGYSRGMTLSEFSQLFEFYGCTQAYNLDGGGSSTMYFNGRVVNNPLGKGNERGTSDIIYVS